MRRARSSSREPSWTRRTRPTGRRGPSPSGARGAWTARELLQRGVWVAPRSRNACKLFQAWGVLEEREGNVALARQLYKCGVKADPTSETTWLTWAKMEERLENPIRAAELRTLCVQQRAEALVGQSDLSPAAMFGIDSALQARAHVARQAAGRAGRRGDRGERLEWLGEAGGRRRARGDSRRASVRGDVVRG